jgi:hypothetical protein
VSGVKCAKEEEVVVVVVMVVVEEDPMPSRINKLNCKYKY